MSKIHELFLLKNSISWVVGESILTALLKTFIWLTKSIKHSTAIHDEMSSLHSCMAFIVNQLF